MTKVSPSRMPVIVLDDRGYAFFHDRHGRSFLPASRYAVRLVTDVAKLCQSDAPELESVVGVRGDGGNIAERYMDAAKFLHAFGKRPAARLVAVTERLMVPAARLREELGLPGGPGLPQTMLFRDKVLMKEHLRGAGIRVPDFAPFSEPAAVALLRAHPAVVVKPRSAAATERVYVLRGADDLAAFTAAYAGNLDEFEVEEHIDGSMFHVDSVVRDGNVVAATAGRYLDETSSYRAAKPCRSVAVPEGPVLDDLLDFNQQVISCYLRFTGVTHHEMFSTGDGWCLCEIAARGGGAGIAAGFWSRTGVNLHQVAVQAQAEDSVPSAIDVARHLTGWVLIHAGPGILLEPIAVPDEEWVVEARIQARPGQLLQAPASCNSSVAAVTVRGDTEAEVIRRLAQVVETASPKVMADMAGRHP